MMIDGKNYIHFNLKVSPEKKQRLNRDWHEVPCDKKRALACPAHKRKCCLMEYFAAFLCFLHMNVQFIDEDCAKPHATNESEDTVSRHASPTDEEGAEEEDTPHVIEEFNDEEERKLSAAIDVEALRGHKIEVGHLVIEADEFSPIPCHAPFFHNHEQNCRNIIITIEEEGRFQYQSDESLQ